MRKAVLLIGTCVVIAAGAILTSALTSPNRARAASTNVAPGRGRTVIAAVPQWWLLEVGPHARSLVIEYPQGGGCSSPATAKLSESARAIRISLRQRVYVPGRGESCSAELRISRLVVWLRSPVAGRPVAQPERVPSPHGNAFPTVSYLWRWVPDLRDSAVALPLTPRITGLSAADATRVLHQEGFHAIVEGHGPVIIGQSPRRDHIAPGSDASHPYAGVVHLIAAAPTR